MTTVIAVIVDATIVTALALLVSRTLRRRSAALRHMILAASLAAAAAAPLFEILLPRYEVPVLTATPQLTSAAAALSSEPSSAAAAETPQAPRLTWTEAVVNGWAIGFLILFARLLGGLARLVWMTRRCRPVEAGLWRERAVALSRQYGLSRTVVILETRDRAHLLTWGRFRPCVIVPAGAASWTAERIDVVLAHEIAHIVRRDWAIQVAAEALCALYWFNPLVWRTCQRLREESEQACDDAVLRRGVDAADYASHLLAVARHLIAVDAGWAAVPAAADATTLERRIAAMLTASRNREPLTRAARVFTMVAMLTLAVPVAAVTLTEQVDLTGALPSVTWDVALVAPAPPQAPNVPAPLAPSVRRVIRRAPAAAPAQQKPASLSGTVRDATGAVVPGVDITLTDTAQAMKYSVTSDGGGTYSFKDLQPGAYELAARLPGFALITQRLTLAAGDELQRNLAMRIGGVVETVTVTCPGSGAAVTPRSAAAVLAFERRPANTPLFAQQAVPVRVGGMILAPRQAKRVPPVCPDTLGKPLVVILEGVIGVDGRVTDVKALRPVSGDQQQGVFVKSAMDAVRQWEFTPTRLNNVPVPVIMTVTVEFARQ